MLNYLGQFRSDDSANCDRSREIVMIREETACVLKLTSRLVEALMTAVICTQELRAALHTDVAQNGTSNGSTNANSLRGQQRLTVRPLLDESTLCVIWNGKSLHLGHTRAFRLMERLARRPNQYVTHVELLRDVWDDEALTIATIRSVDRTSCADGKTAPDGVRDVARQCSGS